MTVYYGASNGISLVGTSTEPIKTPSGVLITRTIETKDGWIGQIIVDKTIVWESTPFSNDEKGDSAQSAERQATKAANERVVSRLTELFS